MKTRYIADLSDGDRVDDVFLICSKAFSMSQNGSQYARIRLADKSGQIEGIHWDVDLNTYAGIATDDYVYVRGQFSRYRDKPQIVVDNIRKFTGKVDPADFLPVSAKDPSRMREDLALVIASIQHPQLSSLLRLFFEDEKFIDVFCQAPAAAKVHHAYISGLLEHTVSVAQLCDAICSRYPQFNRDLLVTGALLHDIGKTEELAWNRSIRYSDSGQLLGHIVIGANMVERAAEKIADFHPMLKLTLVHMILSHHGQLEYGSPKRPKCLEAIALNMLDDMDAKVNTFQQAVDSIEDDSIWTDRHWVFDRPLFRGLPDSVLNHIAQPQVEEPGSNGGDGFELELFGDNN